MRMFRSVICVCVLAMTSLVSYASCPEDGEAEYLKLNEGFENSGFLMNIDFYFERMDFLANCGVYSAAKGLGVLYINRKFVPKDLDKAIDYFVLAYSLKKEDEQDFQLDFMYALQLKVKAKQSGFEDYSAQSLELLEKLYLAGYSQDSDLFYATSLISMKVDPNKGIRILQELDSSGYPKARKYLDHIKTKGL